MIERLNRGSRVKAKSKNNLVFERVEEFKISNLQEAENAIENITMAIRDIELNIERINKHKAMLEFERDEIRGFIGSIKTSELEINPLDID